MKNYTLLFILVILFSTSIKSDGLNTIQIASSIHKTKKPNIKLKPMGISINLYRIATAEKMDDVKNIENEIIKARITKVDLYKMTEDLAIIFLNKPDPWADINSIPYKMMFGNKVSKNMGDYQVGGFLPSSEVKNIVGWIKQNNLSKIEGFSKMYDNLSKDTVHELEEIDSPDKNEMFTAYVKPLVDFYFAALKDHNSIVIIGE